MTIKTHSVFDRAIVLSAVGESFKKLNPVTLARNPVIFVTEVGAVILTILLVTGQGANFGFQLQIALWTRGALTTFSIASDVSKYFAILPPMLVGAFPQIAPLNIMFLKSPQSAILSAPIFKSIILTALIPLALTGIKFQATRRLRDPGAEPLHLRFRRNPPAVFGH